MRPVRTSLIALALAGGCVEYEPMSTLPPVGVPNQRPLEVRTQVDRLVQLRTPEVDVLWVVDNSGSMSQEQHAIAENFPAFMDYFLGSGLDYHIGVTSTDTDELNGDLRLVAGVKWIDPDTPNPSVVFGEMAQMGTNGSAWERCRDPVYQAIELKSGPGGYNDGFYRSEGTLHTVGVSDEDDSSWADIDEFIAWYKALKTQPDGVTFSSIVTPLDDAYGPCPGGSSPGEEYIQVTQAVGGIFWPICDPDWVEVLERLGIQASGLRREYFLSALPVAGTLSVRVVDGGTTRTFAEGVDYVYDPVRNSVLFLEFVPGALAEVFIEYERLDASSGQG